MTRIVQAAALVCMLLGCSKAVEDSAKGSAKNYFKNYALSTCIAGGFESEEVVSEAAAAAGGYLELGDYPLEAHTEATLLARQFLQKDYQSKVGARLVLMKCIDFYNSPELEDLARKFQGMP